MTRRGEIAAVLALSVATHAAALVWIAEGVQGGGGDGAQGDAARSLAAVDPSLVALVDHWDSPPEAGALPQRPDAARPTDAAILPAAQAAPRLPRPPEQIVPPGAEAAPDTAPQPVLRAPTYLSASAAPPPPPVVGDMSPLQTRLAPAPVLSPPPSAPQPSAVDAPDITDTVPEPPAQAGLTQSPRPELRPAPSQPAPSQPTAPARQASGGATGQTEGSTARDASPAAGPPDPGLMAEWGARIAARIAARVPRASATGEMTVQITVDRNGRLVSVALTRSSGDPALDAAGLEVVRRAGRFPAAPGALQGDSFRFNLPLRFT